MAGDGQEPFGCDLDVAAQVTAGEVLVLALLELPAPQGDGPQIRFVRRRQSSHDLTGEGLLLWSRDAEKLERVAHVRPHRHRSCRVSRGRHGLLQAAQDLFGERRHALGHAVQHGRLASMEIGQAQALWQPRPGWLDTAAYGIPPQPAVDALRGAIADWQVGGAPWETWNASTQTARESFARLVGVDAEDVAVGAQVSQMVAPFAAMLPEGARVVVPEIEFASNLFPWLVQAERGVQVTTVATADLLDAIRPGTDVVAFGLVQSATGEVAPYEQIVAAAREVNALVVVDATQACGWLPFDAGLADVVVVGAYKWLMSPRGSAFAYVAPEVRDRVRPDAAGWFSAEDPFTSYFGPPLRLAKSARRLDISPAWFVWVGTAPALDVVEQIGVRPIHDHNVALANRFLAGLGLPPGDSAIVTVDVADAADKLKAAGVRASVRAGRVRAAFHVYTTERDVDMALDALAG
jgi:selenocysteine lyase/cysteine desulfurase